MSKKISKPMPTITKLPPKETEKKIIKIEDPEKKDADGAQEAVAEPEKNFPSMEYDRYFLEWLKQVKQSILVTSYKTNFVFCIGFTHLIEPEQREQLSFWMTSSARCMGAAQCDNGNSVWIGNMSYLTKYCKFGEQVDEGEGYKRDPFDGLFVPRKIHVTSDIDIHDITIPAGGENPGVPHFISAVYSCVCTPSEDHSFKVYWKPPWISKVAAEDRTHLNGLCCVNGVPRYVTACSRSDVRGGWREHKRDGGVIYDIVSDALVCKGLSMPHSPRWNDGKLWVLNSGKGQFGYIDFTVTKEDGGEEYYPFVSCCFIPGYLRGLSFIDNRYAVIGSSDDRHEQTFQDLELGETLKAKGTTAKCGIHIVDLKTFDIIHEMRFEKPITELYDVVVVPNTIRPILDELAPLGLSRRLNVEE